MTLIELGSGDAVREFLNKHRNVVVTFSAHWCGPCKRSKPALEQLAVQLTADPNIDVAMGIVYENDLGDEIHRYGVRAFPTHILFQEYGAKETNRVEGASIPGIQSMVSSSCKGSMPSRGGETLGGAASGTSPEQARAARLAKLEAAMGPAMAAAQSAAAATPGRGSAENNTTAEPMDTEDKKPSGDEKNSNDSEAKNDDDKKGDDGTKDVEMKDGGHDTTRDGKEGEAEASATTIIDPAEGLDPVALETLMNEMGFPKIRAQKGLLYGNGSSVESAVEWLMEHQDDDDIDKPIPPVTKAADGTSGASLVSQSYKCNECVDGTSGASLVAQSYKCNECGKILSNMANLELHANKTGHSDFEESTEHVKPLTPEEKAKKIAEIKELLKAKRAEREAEEKTDDKEREKQRRFMGKEMAKTREQMEMEQRKRDAMLRKKEKDDAKRERDRIRAELAKDKAERQANKGKLSSKLGIDGYNPDGIQYDVDAPGASGESGGGQQPPVTKKAKADVGRIDEYIAKVSTYKAGGDGGKCLKVLKAYVSNLVKDPTDDRFKRINMENTAYKTKVKPFLGAKNLLLAIGFKQAEDDRTALILNDDPPPDMTLLEQTKVKLEEALAKYG